MATPSPSVDELRRLPPPSVDRLSILPTEIVDEIVALLCRSPITDVTDPDPDDEEEYSNSLEMSRQLSLTSKRFHDSAVRFKFEVVRLKFRDTSYEKLEQVARSPYRNCVKVIHYLGHPFRLDDRVANFSRLRSSICEFVNLEGFRFDFGLERDAPDVGYGHDSEDSVSSWRHHIESVLDALTFRYEKTIFERPGDEAKVLKDLRIDGICPFPGLFFSNRLLSDGITIFQNLTQLSIVACWTEPQAFRLPEFLDNFTKLLSSAVLLKTLHIDASNTVIETLGPTCCLRMTGAILSMSFHFLEAFEISDFYVRLDDVLEFTMRHKKTLKTLALLYTQFFIASEDEDYTSITIDWRQHLQALDLSKDEHKAILRGVFKLIGEQTIIEDVSLQAFFPCGDYGDENIQVPNYMRYWQQQVYHYISDPKDSTDPMNTWNPNTIRKIYYGWACLLTGGRSGATWQLFPEPIGGKEDHLPSEMFVSEYQPVYESSSYLVNRLLSL